MCIHTSKIAEADTQTPDQFTAFELVNLSFSEILDLGWDMCETIDYSDGGYNEWDCTCTYGDESVFFNFYEMEYQNSDAVPWSISVEDGQMGDLEIPLTSKIHTGMTYEGICALGNEDEYFAQWDSSGELQEGYEEYWEYYWNEEWCGIRSCVLPSESVPQRAAACDVSPRPSYSSIGVTEACYHRNRRSDDEKRQKLSQIPEFAAK